MSNLIFYINREEGASLLGVTVKSLCNMEKKGWIPTPAVRIHNDKTGRPNIGYDRAEFMAWVKTNPVRHIGYQNPEKRQHRHAETRKRQAEKTNQSDVWNIRKPKPCFQYNGKAMNIIIFCQPKLLNRGLKYESSGEI